jgi:hypothetical protein
MYLHPFKNQYRDHDFTLIADTIEKYFPANKSRRLTPKTVATSPGFKKIGKIVNEEFLNQKAYREKWGKLTSNLKKALKKPVYGNPDLGGGGFVGEVIIEEDKTPDFIRKKALKFYVSILGPFFTIHGVDSSIALLEFESGARGFTKGNFAATNAITLSPVFEYKEVFNKLEDELRSFFPGYLFVPHVIGMSTIKNISVADELRDPRSLDTIYEALFGTVAVHDCLTRGDQRYGMNDWEKSLNKKEKSLIDVISQHIITAPKEITIHKVWKLQGSKRLETLKISGNLMFGVDLFDVIDLTDMSKFILISRKRGAPSAGKYKINNEVIKINSNLSFRIVELSKTSLTLNLILNFENGGVSVNGEAMELKFVQMKRID